MTHYTMDRSRQRLCLVSLCILSVGVVCIDIFGATDGFQLCALIATFLLGVVAVGWWRPAVFGAVDTAWFEGQELVLASGNTSARFPLDGITARISRTRHHVQSIIVSVGNGREDLSLLNNLDAFAQELTERMKQVHKEPITRRAFFSPRYMWIHHLGLTGLVLAMYAGYRMSILPTGPFILIMACGGIVHLVRGHPAKLLKPSVVDQKEANGIVFVVFAVIFIAQTFFFGLS